MNASQTKGTLAAWKTLLINFSTWGSQQKGMFFPEHPHPGLTATWRLWLGESARRGGQVYSTSPKSYNHFQPIVSFAIIIWEKDHTVAPSGTHLQLKTGMIFLNFSQMGSIKIKKNSSHGRKKKKDWLRLEIRANKMLWRLISPLSSQWFWW